MITALNDYKTTLSSDLGDVESGLEAISGSIRAAKTRSEQFDSIKRLADKIECTEDCFMSTEQADRILNSLDRNDDQVNTMLSKINAKATSAVGDGAGELFLKQSRLKNIALKEGNHKRTIKRTMPSIKRFLTKQDWETGGKTVMDELIDVTTGLAKNGVLAGLAADARRDYVQLLLAKTYLAQAQAASDNTNNIAIDNNENLITALVGQDHGDGNNNLLKTVKDSLLQNANSIKNKLDQKGDFIGSKIDANTVSIGGKLDEKAASIIQRLGVNAAHIGTKIDTNSNTLGLKLDAKAQSIIDEIKKNTDSTGDQLVDVNDKMKEWHDTHLDGQYDIAAMAVSNHLANIYGLELPFPDAIGRRTAGPLHRDGIELSPGDTELSVDYLAEEAAATFDNMTEGERAAVMALDADDLLLLLQSVTKDGKVAGVPESGGNLF